VIVTLQDLKRARRGVLSALGESVKSIHELIPHSNSYRL
jgi:hypothetical protein